MGFRYERVVGLQLFSRRLSQLTSEKFSIMLAKYSVENPDRYDTHEWTEVQEQMLKTNKLLTRQRSI
jgi:hypothetical protein